MSRRQSHFAEHPMYLLDTKFPPITLVARCRGGPCRFQAERGNSREKISPSVSYSPQT